MKPSTVTMVVHGVRLSVAVVRDGPARRPGPLRRWNVRLAGNVQAIDDLIECEILSEIDRRIRAGEYDGEDGEEDDPLGLRSILVRDRLAEAREKGVGPGGRPV